MCTEAIVIRNGESIACGTVGELSAALGVPAATVCDDPEWCCLCNAKWAELGARQATEDEGWPFPEYIIVESPAHQSPQAIHGRQGSVGGSGRKARV